MYYSSDYGMTWRVVERVGYKQWNGVSLSSTGQYQTAVVTSGNIWTSSNFGVTWTERTTGATRSWQSVSISSTGQYQTAVATSGNIWTSSDFCVTCTERTTGATRNWLSVSISSTGQYQTAVVNGGSIYTSSDFGVTWVQRSTATRTNEFTRIKSSASGQYQLATSGPTGNTNGQLYVSSDYGRTWMPRRGLATWLGGAVSATGGVMMTMTMTPAPPTTIKINGALSYSPILYLDATNSSSYNGSTNTWTNLGSLGGNVVMTYMSAFDAADNGGSFNFDGASNFGSLTVASTTLTQATFIAVVKTTGLNTGWAEILGFGTGSSLFIGTLSNVLNYYYSGSNSSNFRLSAGVWYSIAFTISTSGSLIFYVNGQSILSTTVGAISKTETIFGIGAGLYSTNSSDSERWNGKISSLAVYNRALTASEIASLYFSTALLRSTDYGASFSDIPNTTLTSPAYWRAIATTNSAAIQTALAHGSTIYRSTDYGSTWNSSAVVDVVGILTTEFSSIASPTYAWKSIAMSSSDAKYQTGVVTNGQIYVNSNYGRGTWTAVDARAIGPEWRCRRTGDTNPRW